MEALSKSVVHEICTNQVVVTLHACVKELLENSLDAGATRIEVRLRENGTELLEVVDDGRGITPEDYAKLATRHATSKIRQYDDLSESLETFGFRGEALAAICAMGDMTVSTRTPAEDSATLLTYDRFGKLASQAQAAREVGTTVSVRELFKRLPVRHREFMRNAKAQVTNTLRLMQAYSIVRPEVIFHVVAERSRGHASSRSTLLSTSGTARGWRLAAASVLGDAVVADTVPFDFQSESTGWSVSGLVSSPVGGRRVRDAQLFFVNRRPIDPPKRIAKLINDTFHQYNSRLWPVVILSFTAEQSQVDVNVTPDKRTVFLHNEEVLLADLQKGLTGVYAPANQGPGVSLADFGIRGGKRQASAEAAAPPGAAGDGGEDAEPSGAAYGALVQTPEAARGSHCALETPAKLSAAPASPAAPPSPRPLEPEPAELGHELDGFQVVEFALEPSAAPAAASGPPELSHELDGFQVVELDAAEPPSAPAAGAANAPSAWSQPLQWWPSAEGGGSPDIEMVTGDGAMMLEPLPSPEAGESSAVVLAPSATAEPRAPAAAALRQAIGGSVIAAASMAEIEAAAARRRQRAAQQPAGSAPSTEVHFPSAFSLASLRGPEKGRASLDAVAKFATFDAKVKGNGADAETPDKFQFDKSCFSKMRVVGQFNLGFIIAALKTSGDAADGGDSGLQLFIVDQHASDEKFRFEGLNRESKIDRQPLVSKHRLQLTPAQEQLAESHFDVFRMNGFELGRDEDRPPGRRLHLATLPTCQGMVFGERDVHDLLYTLEETEADQSRPSQRDASGGGGLLDLAGHRALWSSTAVPRPAKVWQLLACRACRGAIMIGKALRVADMEKILSNLGGLRQPWNCPHGRPTMRHLVSTAVARKVAPRAPPLGPLVLAADGAPLVQHWR